jgi:hypothetical protein
MEENNHNLDNSVESNEINITTPEGMEQVENIFNEQNISPDILPNNDLEQFWFAGNLDTFLATGEDTNGEYSLFDLYVPTGGQTRGHFHTEENEVFKVVSDHHVDQTNLMCLDQQEKVKNIYLV